MISHTVTAPGKLILFGEHAIVYGKHALATSLGLYTEIQASILPQRELVLQFDNLAFHSRFVFSFENLRELLKCHKSTLSKLASGAVSAIDLGLEPLYLQTILALFLCLCDLDSDTGIRLDIRSTIPLASGLGSSGSLAAAVAGSLLSSHLCLRHPDCVDQLCFERNKSDALRRINFWALVGERLAHGNPSGIDNTVSVYGGLLKYSSAAPEFLDPKVLNRFGLVLVNTTIPRNTSVVVQQVRRRVDGDPQSCSALFDQIDQIVDCCSQLFAVPNHNIYSTLQHLLSQNQQCLKKLGVSHSLIDEILDQLSKVGIMGKITGAGQGGHFFVLVQTSQEKTWVETVLDQYPQVSHSIPRIGVPGLCIDYSPLV